MKEIREHVHDESYSGSVLVDQRELLARLEVSVDCEAELAVLLMSASRKGILRLDRILPFLTPDALPVLP